MADPRLVAVRTGLRILPRRLRARATARLFLGVPHHPEPEREAALRRRGEEVTVGGMPGVAFGDGPTVLLLHGWAGRGLQMGAFVDPLVAKGYRVIALDGPDHGRDHGKMSGLPPWVRAVSAAIEEAAPHAIAAHSFGGAAAILAADRTGYRGRLVFLGGPPESAHIFERARRLLDLDEKDRELFIRRLESMFDIDRNDYNVEEAAGRIGCLMLALLARDDDELPTRESRTIVEGGGGTVVELDAGHRSVMWNDEAVRLGVDFIAGPA